MLLLLSWVSFRAGGEQAPPSPHQPYPPTVYIAACAPLGRTNEKEQRLPFVHAIALCGTGGRGNPLAAHAILTAAESPCTRALSKGRRPRRLPNAGRDRVRASSARANTCAYCPPAHDLASSAAINTGPPKNPPLRFLARPRGRTELDDLAAYPAPYPDAWGPWPRRIR